jgi:hypothetical protein
VLNLQGIIRNVSYQPCLSPKLTEYDFDDFDINAAKGYGIVHVGGNALGYSKWVSPKRTRSYPYARIYDTYHLPKRVTVIPVIKDEGIRGDNDRINVITLSLMNLLNIFVILVWYEDARPHLTRDGKVTNQLMPVQYVRDKLEEINQYQQTALHWNLAHFERDFVDVYQHAMESYRTIAAKTGIRMHAESDQVGALNRFMVDGKFHIESFRQISLVRSRGAAQRETVVQHLQEFLQDGDKAYFTLENYLGGEYHLTADEVYSDGARLVVQESKNTTKAKLPSLNDIKDGLLKLILYSNMDELRREGVSVPFTTQLKLTGNISGSLRLPSDADAINAFVRRNGFTPSRCAVVDRLNEEASRNRNLNILITGNQ